MPTHAATDPVVDSVLFLHSPCWETGLLRGASHCPTYEGVHFPVWSLLEIARKTTPEDQVPALVWP